MGKRTAEKQFGRQSCRLQNTAWRTWRASGDISSCTPVPTRQVTVGSEAFSGNSVTGNRTTMNPSKSRTLKMIPCAHAVYLRITYDAHSQPSCPSLPLLHSQTGLYNEAQCVLCKVPTNPLQIVQTLNSFKTPSHTTTNVSDSVRIQPICTGHSGQSLWWRRHNCPASGSCGGAASLDTDCTGRRWTNCRRLWIALYFVKLTLQSPVVTIGTTTFCVHLRTNSDYFPVQH